VPLARLSKRVFTTDEKLEAELEVAHFGGKPIEDATVAWRLVDDAGKAVMNGTLLSKTIPVDNGIPLGSISADLTRVPAPARYQLVVNLGWPSRRPAERRDARPAFENAWDVWVYPPKVDTSVPAGVTIVNELDEAAVAALNTGGKVLLMIPPGRVKGDPKIGKVALGFSSIFWNTAWTGRQAPHTLGILCDPKHPALADFPTDFHSNWQWWYLVNQAGAMILDDLPAGLRPTVQVIDDWFTARRLGLVFEAKVGRGKLLVCSIDLRTSSDKNPVARQMLRSLLRYMDGKKFNPRTAVSAEGVRSLMTAPSVARLKVSEAR